MRGQLKVLTSIQTNQIDSLEPMGRSQPLTYIQVPLITAALDPAARTHLDHVPTLEIQQALQSIYYMHKRVKRSIYQLSSTLKLPLCYPCLQTLPLRDLPGIAILLSHIHKQRTQADGGSCAPVSPAINKSKKQTLDPACNKPSKLSNAIGWQPSRRLVTNTPAVGPA